MAHFKAEKPQMNPVFALPAKIFHLVKLPGEDVPAIIVNEKTVDFGMLQLPCNAKYCRDSQKTTYSFGSYTLLEKAREHLKHRGYAEQKQDNDRARRAG